MVDDYAVYDLRATEFAPAFACGGLHHALSVLTYDFRGVFFLDRAGVEAAARSAGHTASSAATGGASDWGT